MTDEFDIAIVGGGAAGIAAAAALAGRFSVVLLEARERLGGRAWTADVGGFAQDLGCGWLHSADINPLAALAEQQGWRLDKSPPHWTRQAFNADFPPQDQAAYRQAMDGLEGRIEAAAARGEDRPASELMIPGDRWNPLLHAFSAYYNGAEFDRVSTLDYDAYEDTGVNWRLAQGYGAMIAAQAAGEIVTGAPVRRIDHGGPRLKLETPRGTLSARLAIVTVPTPLIAEGGLAFAPDLPAAREAAAGLPLGLADKVLLAVEGADDLPREGHLFGSPDRTETGSYHLRPFGRPLIEVFLGGRHALSLEGEGAAAAFAMEELGRLLGSDLRRRLAPLAATAWAADPWSRGSYSHALPGHAGDRAVLAAAGGERILFAGEACSPRHFSTAHGAWESGLDAAARALARLG